MTDFHVVPDALVGCANYLSEADLKWATAVQSLTQAMSDDACGLLGKTANLPKAFNEARQEIVDRLTLSGQSLADAQARIKQTADAYEQKDAEWYAQFGYIDEHVR